MQDFAAQDPPGEGPTRIPESPARPVRLSPFRGIYLPARSIGDPATVRTLARPQRDIGHRLHAWEREGRLVRDDQPGFYLHEYSSQGITVRGVVGALDLTSRAHRHEERAVVPHEATHQRQTRNLAGRMEHLGLNPAPILLLHRGRPQWRALLDEVAADEPARAYDDRTGQGHRLWPIRDAERWDRIARELTGSRLLLADGHHRFAAYLQLQEAHPGTGWDRGLVLIIDQEDTPLFLGPIHRTFDPCPVQDLVTAAIAAGAQVRRHRSRRRALDRLAPGTWLMTDGSSWHSVTDPEHCAERATIHHLHEVTMPLLRGRPQVTYHHTAEEALGLAGAQRTAVLLPAPEPDLLEAAADRGELLPEKATSFQPKPNVGVLMRAPEDI